MMVFKDPGQFVRRCMYAFFLYCSVKISRMHVFQAGDLGRESHLSCAQFLPEQRIWYACIVISYRAVKERWIPHCITVLARNPVLVEYRSDQVCFCLYVDV
jgi:hypothetical protein